MKTILIVDDTFENLYLLKIILEGAGYNVVEAKEGKEGLKQLKENNIDLIISDILMPVMDDYLFCQACKQNDATKNIPFVFYTSTYTEKLDEDLALKLGAVHFLRKPTDQDKIISVIENIFNTIKPINELLENKEFSEKEVLKLYSNRLISKLEDKNLDLEKEVIEREKAQQLLIHKNEILDLIAVNTPLNEIFNKLLLNFESVHSNYFGAISLLSSDGEFLNLGAAPSMPKSYNTFVKSLPTKTSKGSCGTAVTTKKPVIVSDISTDPLWDKDRQLALDHGFMSCWSIPILSKEDTVLGTFAIYSKTINTPTLEEVKELNFASNLAKIAIEKFNAVLEIKKKDESYKSLVNQASDSIISYSLDGTIYAFNQAAYTRLGYTKKEFSKFTLKDILIGEIVLVKENRKKILAGEPVFVERQLIKKDKTLVDYELSAKQQKDGRILSIGRDITERKKEKLKLQESEYNLRQSQIVANIGTYVIDVKKETWEGSEVLYLVFGIDQDYPKTLEGWGERIHPDDKEEVKSYLFNCIKNNKKFNKEYRIIKLNTKKEVWVQGVGELVYDEIGNPIQLLGTIQDITERKRAEIELRSANEFSLSLLNSMHEGLVVIDMYAKIIRVNPAFCKMTGFNEKELLGATRPFPYSPPELKKGNDERYRLLKANKNKKEYENTYMRKNGERFSVYVSISSIYDEKGNKVANFSTVQDISERKAAQKKLLESEYSLRQSQAVANIGSLTVDLKAETWEGSEVMDKIFGIDKTFVRSLENWKNLIHPEERELMVDYLLNTIKNNTKYDIEYRLIRHSDNKEIWVHGIGETFFDGNAKPIGMIGTIQDITERKQSRIKLQISENNLRQSQTAANIGSITIFFESLNWECSQVLDNIFGIDHTYVKTLENWKDLLHPEEREEVYHYFENSIYESGKHNKEYRIIRPKDKREVWVHAIGETIFNKENVPIKMVGTIQDITERKQAEIKLQQSEYYLKQSQKVANTGSLLVDLETMTWQGSSVLDNIFGINKTFKKTIENWKALVHPEDKEEIVQYMFNCIENKAKFNKEYRVIRPADKKIIWVHGIGDNILNSAEVPIKMIGTIQDITERKEAEIALSLAKEFTDKLIMSMQEGLLIIDLDTKIIMVNDALCKLTGYSEDELSGFKHPYPFWEKSDHNTVFAMSYRSNKELVREVHCDLIKKNGKKITASFFTGTIKNDKEEVVAIYATVKDVSEELQAKQILINKARESTEKKDVILKLANLIGEDFDLSLSKIAKSAAKTLNVALLTIWEYQKNNHELLSKVFYNSLEGYIERDKLIISEKDYPNYFKAVKENTIINIENVNSSPITKAFSEKYFIPNKISSRIDVVIYGRNNNYGILSFECTIPNRVFTAEEESFVTSIANIVSLMVESKERTLAENRTELTNQKLLEANKELNALKEQLEEENVYLRNELDLVFNYEEMVYGSEEFSNVLTEVEKVAPTTATVLLLGESGTGKELLARAIHNTSLRNDKPLIKVNCSAIPRELMESELFGHKKGSFTGAISDKIGKFELANGGTLFLDEIGELPLDMQPKILRFLQEGEIEVVGGTTGLKKLDVRVIAATNRNLKEEIKKKLFREDLYFRLNVFPIVVPPLRQRKDDVPLLVEHFVDKFNKAYGKNIKYINDDAMNKLKAYDWPGNIRELENLIERASILSNKETLTIPGFESSKQVPKSINNVDLSLNTVQKNHIIQVLEQCNWKISGPKGAAVILDLKPSTLRDRMTKLQIIKPG